MNPELSQANEFSARNDKVDDAATSNPKIHQAVRFNKMGDDDDTSNEAEVLSRAEKTTEKYKNCFNICFKSPPDIAEETGYIDFRSDVKKWNLITEQENQRDHQSEERVESSVTSEGAVVYNLEKTAVDQYSLRASYLNSLPITCHVTWSIIALATCYNCFEGHCEKYFQSFTETDLQEKRKQHLVFSGKLKKNSRN